MDLTTGIQRAIDYMEANLTDELDYGEIAGKAHVSSFHFQRIFHILSGHTLGEYIRSRRLTQAAFELQSGHKVIDVALKFGYETPESFSRAFERFHGILPSAAKEKGANLKSFSRLSIKILLEGGSVMDYRIEEEPGFRLLGKAVRDTDGGGNGGRLWKACHADGTMELLTKYSTSLQKEHIGVLDGTTYYEKDKSWLYYVATPYNGEEVPEGFIVTEIPAR
ncbi:MAG: AraC family transcriptional regulator, partial [Clostridiales bacterium]|nr:AraC family transcriptional regulator [Clostridiales bacterium]